MRETLFGVAVLFATLRCPQLLGQASGPGADSAQAAGLPEWQASKLMAGLLYMPLLGERSKPGPYVYRVRGPDGFRVPPHWHTRTMHQTVLGGTLVIVMGEPLDSTRARRYGPGSFLVTPAGMRHAEWFEGETTVHVETEGPFETVFINPRDDPRNRARP